MVEDQDGAPISQALQDVIDERSRQISEEGYDAKHDDDHTQGELARAAACYIDPHFEFGLERYAPRRWPYDQEFWKPKDRRRDLVRAAALVVAEIERLDRLS